MATGEARAGYVYDDNWNPPNVFIDASHPYYFRMVLPDWDFEKKDYDKATFDLTYLDQCWLDIFVFAAKPTSDLSNPSSYNILIGTVPFTGYVASGTARFNLLTALDEGAFNALFKDQTALNLVADCHYIFDKTSLHLEANQVPIPAPILLLGSGLAGLIGLRRKMQ